MRTDEVRAIFARLQPEISALVAEHAAGPGDDDLPPGPFPIPAQQALSRELIERFGASWDAFRLDLTVHPFAATFGARRHPADDPRTRRTTSTRSSPRCTSAVTGCTSTASARRSTARRSARALRPRSTSRKAGCGRTSSGARFRSGGGSILGCRSRSRIGSATCRSSASTAP